MKSFWNEAKEPFFILAPMEDVTDTVFRQIVLSVSNPEILKVVFTEFTSTDGLTDHRGFEKTSERLLVNTSEIDMLNRRGSKLVAQIWGNDPEKFYRSAMLISQQVHFDGIDINMGCPVKKVVVKGTCSALIKNPALAAEIITATKEGTKLPVSVKTRIGFNSIVTEDWIGHLLEQDLAAITIHGRTQKMQSEGLANWDEIGKAVSLRDSMQKSTAIIGNGDVVSYQQGINLANTHKLEGVMVGRGVFKNPWMFKKELGLLEPNERIELLRAHLQLYTATWGNNKNFNILKRFFKIYLSNFRGAAELRDKLMHTNNAYEVEQTLLHTEVLNSANQSGINF